MNSLDENLRYPSLIIDGKGSISSAREYAVEIARTLTEKSGTVETISPEKDKKSISIEQARDLRKKLTLSSYSNTYRVFIIDNVSLMGDEAQNSLLKILEELGHNTTIIMPIAQKSDVLPTIRSRSRVLGVQNILETSVNDKQKMIDSAMLDYKFNYDITESDIVEAMNFIKYTVADRLYAYKDKNDDKDCIMRLLISLRVLCISTMRKVPNNKAKLAWAHKLEDINDLLDKSQSNTPSKLLLLGAATKL